MNGNNVVELLDEAQSGEAEKYGWF